MKRWSSSTLGLLDVDWHCVWGMHDCAVLFFAWQQKRIAVGLGYRPNRRALRGSPQRMLLNIKMCVFEEVLWPIYATVCAQAPVQYLPYHPFGFEWHFNGRTAFFPPLHPSGVVYIPCHTTFEIHFQVNILWLATNLQPTGVVTAVPDNSQNKLLSHSGMFTVATDTVRQTF